MAHDVGFHVVVIQPLEAVNLLGGRLHNLNLEAGEVFHQFQQGVVLSGVGLASGLGLGLGHLDLLSHQVSVHFCNLL